MAPIQPAEIQYALQGLEKARALHLHDANVSLVDVGYRIRDSKKRRVTNEVAVRVHVRKKIPRGAAFENFKARHPERVPDKDRIGFKTDVPEALYGLHDYWYWYYYMPVAGPRTGVANPLRGGISISNELQYGSGTLGGKVVDRETGDDMLLSNWHVLVGAWSARPGLNIYQPGQMDGGRVEHTVARLTRHAFDKGMDAAVAKLTGKREFINQQLDLGPVKGVMEPVLGMKVVKSGRKSKVTKGMITGIGGYAKFFYDGIQRFVRNVVHITPISTTAEVSAPGDSGSWWLEAETNHAVALHFAGSNAPEYGLGISMPRVLDALKVDIALSRDSR